MPELNPSITVDGQPVASAEVGSQESRGPHTPGGSTGGEGGEAGAGIYYKSGKQKEALSQGASSTAGDQAPKWIAQLPKDLPAEKLQALTKFKTLADFHAAYDSQAAELATLRSAAEASKPPGSPEGYKLTATDPRVRTFLSATAHDLGLSQQQAASLEAGYLRLVKQGRQARDEKLRAARQRCELVLKREFGGDYSVAVEAAQRALRTFATPDLLEDLYRADAEGNIMGNSPGFVRLMARLYREFLAEESFAPGSPKSPGAQDDGGLEAVYNRSPELHGKG